MTLLQFETPRGPVWINPKYVWSVGSPMDKDGHVIVGLAAINMVTGDNLVIKGNPSDLARVLTSKMQPVPDYLKSEKN